MKEDDVNVIIKKLTDELVWLFHDVDEYLILFEKNDDQRKILDKTAPHFFIILHQYYWERFVIGVSRITDPKGNKNNTNLSVFCLEDIYKKEKLNIDILDEKFKEIKERSKSIRNRRRKLIAHRDRKTILRNEYDNYNIKLVEVISVIKTIGELINDYYKQIGKPIYSWHLHASNGTETLLYYLKEALVYEEIKDKRKDWIKDNKEIEESTYGKIILNRKNDLWKNYM